MGEQTLKRVSHIRFKEKLRVEHLIFVNGGCIFLELGYGHTSIFSPLFIPTLQAGFELSTSPGEQNAHVKNCKNFHTSISSFLLFLLMAYEVSWDYSKPGIQDQY